MIDIRKVAKKFGKKILLNEVEDERVFKAAKLILRKKIAKLGVVKTTRRVAELKKLGAEVFDPKDYDFSDVLYKSRIGKITPEEAEVLSKKVNYFSVLLVKEGYVDGLVSGAIHTTAETLRPALQLLKTSHRASGAFIMRKARKVFIFADCAVNINPSSDDLAYIAHDSVETARMLGIRPKVAFLSYSTNGSGKGAEKVREAWETFRKMHPGIQSCGEIQVDAALNETVRRIKWPKCPMKGVANVLIFPDLNSGNIGYKLVQRLGGFEAIGPIIQGLERPVNDLSRGCSVKEIVDLVALTSIQAKKLEK